LDTCVRLVIQQHTSQPHCAEHPTQQTQHTTVTIITDTLIVRLHISIDHVRDKATSTGDTPSPSPYYRFVRL